MDYPILNSYHHVRYGSGHQLLRSSSSGSSQTSPEYQPQEYPHHRKSWESQDWSRNETINMTRSQVTSSDEDENVDVQDLIHEGLEGEEVEENLVEGHDYDVIQVYAVDPDLDLEVSDDEKNEESEDYSDKGTIEANFSHTQDKNTTMEQNFNLDATVYNEDYFKDYKDILAVKDEPVVIDVDEYFIKEDKPKIPIQNEPLSIRVPQLSKKKDESVNIPNVNKETVLQKEPIVDDSTTGTELEILPNIEHLRRFLLEDMTYTKFKTAQRSCSLPQSPMHNICLDIDDSKTCLSFEDLDLDLSDLVFDNFRDKSDNSNKNDDMPRTLTEEDVNSFLIRNENIMNPEAIPEETVELNTLEKSVINPDEDDLSQQDMEIEHPTENTVSSVLDSSEVLPQVKSAVTAKNIIVVKADNLPYIETPLVTSKNVKSIKTKKFSKNETLAHLHSKPIKPLKTGKSKPHTVVANPIPTMKQKYNVLDFCIEKKEIKAEPDDFVDVVSCNDTTIPVLEANNLSSLLEQFEASEKLQVKPKKTFKVETIVKAMKSEELASLTSGMRLQEAGVKLNKTKMRQILMPSTIPLNTSIKRSPSPVHSDHDYCSTKKRHSPPNIKGGQSLLKPEVLSSNSRILNSRHRSCKNKKVAYHLNSEEERTVVKDKNTTTRDNCDVKLKISGFKSTVNKVIHQPTCKKPSLVNLDDFSKSNCSVIKKEASEACDTLDSQSSNASLKLIIKNKSEVIINCDGIDSQKVKIKDECNQNVKVNTKVMNVNKKKLNDKDKSSNVMTAGKGVDNDINNLVNSIQETKHCINVDGKIEPTEKTEDFYIGLFENKHDLQIPQVMQPKAAKRTFNEEVSIKHKQYNETEQPMKKKKLNLQEYKLRRGVNSNNSSATVSPEPIFPEMPILQNVKLAKPILNKIQSDVVTKEQANHETPFKIFDPIREASRKILMNSKKHKAEVMRRKEEDLVKRKIPKVESLDLQPLISDEEMLKMVNMVSKELLIDKIEDKVHPVQQDKLKRPQASPVYEELILISVGVNTDNKMFEELEKHSKRTKSESPTDSKFLINFKIKKTDQVMKQNVFDQIRDKKGHAEDSKVTQMDKERFKDITATLKSVQKQVDTKISSNSLFASIKDVVERKAPHAALRVSAKSDKRANFFAPVCFPSSKTIIVRDYEASAEHGEDKVIIHLVRGRSKPKSSTIDTQTDPISINAHIGQVKTEFGEEIQPSSRKRNDSDMSISSDVSLSKIHSTYKNIERQIPSKSEKRCRSSDHYDKFQSSRSRSPSQRRRRSHSRSRSRARERQRRNRKKRRSNSRRRRSPSIRREYRSKRSRSVRSRSGSSISRSMTPLAKRSSRNCVERKAEKSVTSARSRTVSESSRSSSSSTSSSSSSSSASSDGSRNSRRSPPYSREELSMKYRRFSSEDREANTPVEERRIVFVGRLEKDITKSGLHAQFVKFGPVTEVRLHTKENGSRYGFVTFERARDAFCAVEAAATLSQYDVGFGGRRAFCRHTYADLDGLEAKYTESAFHGGGGALVSSRHTNHMSFEQMLMDMKRKLSQRKGDRDKENDD